MEDEEYVGMRCPHCDAQTNVDPALIKEGDPMPYCIECDMPLFFPNYGQPEFYGMDWLIDLDF